MCNRVSKCDILSDVDVHLSEKLNSSPTISCNDIVSLHESKFHTMKISKSCHASKDNQKLVMSRLLCKYMCSEHRSVRMVCFLHDAWNHESEELSNKFV